MKIICFGDSNTWGWDPRSYWGGRYDAPWTEILAENTGWTVINLGENGREIPSSENQLQWAREDITENLPADLLVILLGSNDVLNSSRNAEELVEKRMDHFLKFFRQQFSDIPILLLAPLPITIYGPVMEEASLRFPEIYSKLAEKYQTYFADCGKWNLSLTFDGVHLTEKAHFTMAEQMQKVISEVVRVIG